MTPAIRELEASNVPFSTHEYEHDGPLRDFGMVAANSLGLDPDQVFKTLLVTFDAGDGRSNNAVAIVPVSCQLALKSVGQALGVKRVAMCDPQVAERVTGYVLGGISPFGQRKRLPTVLDEMASLFDTIYVSGGKRGLDIGVRPEGLITILDAVVANISSE